LRERDANLGVNEDLCAGQPHITKDVRQGARVRKSRKKKSLKIYVAAF